MFIFKTTNIDICFASNNIEQIQKFVSDIESMRKFLKTMGNNCNETCNEIIDLDAEYLSLQSKFQEYTRTVTDNFSDGDALIKQMDSRHSTVFLEVANKYFETHGKPDWFDYDKNIEPLLDTHQVIYYEIIRLDFMNEDLNKTGYNVPESEIVESGDFS